MIIYYETWLRRLALAQLPFIVYNKGRIVELCTMHEGRRMINHALCSHPLKSGTLLDRDAYGMAFNQKMQTSAEFGKRLPLGEMVAL
jgi:hypothetical protein